MHPERGVPAPPAPRAYRSSRSHGRPIPYPPAVPGGRTRRPADRHGPRRKMDDLGRVKSDDKGPFRHQRSTRSGPARTKGWSMDRSARTSPFDILLARAEASASALRVWRHAGTYLQCFGKGKGARRPPGPFMHAVIIRGCRCRHRRSVPTRTGHRCPWDARPRGPLPFRAWGAPSLVPPAWARPDAEP